MTKRYLLLSFIALTFTTAACDSPPPADPVAPPVALVPAPALPSPVEEARDIAPVPEPNAAPVADIHPAPAAKQTRVRIVDSAIATSVEQRVPTGLGEVFGTEVGTVWAWIAVENLGEPTNVTMVWRRDDKVRSSLELSVGTSRRWRTWSRNRIRKFDAGEWTVDMYDAEGNLLDTLEFTIRDTGEVG